MGRPRKQPLRPGMGRRPDHGARALERRLRDNALDGRTRTARALREIQLALAEDAGGWDRLTARERLLIERAAAQAVICRSIEDWLFTHHDTPVRPDGQLIGILRRGYTTHAAALTRMLAALGLRPDRRDQILSLSDYVDAHSSTPDPQEDSDAPDPPDPSG